MQTEAFLPSLTVWETLNITASLRLPESLSRNQKNALMQTTIESMGLIKVRQTQVRTQPLQPIQTPCAAAPCLHNQSVSGWPPGCSMLHARLMVGTKSLQRQRLCASGTPIRQRLKAAA